MAEKKTAYHSELSKYPEGLLCTVDSDVLKSKFQGKPDYVMLTVEHDGQRYSKHYLVENETCAGRLRGRKGQKLLLRFEGSRESADIRILSSAHSSGQPRQPEPSDNDGGNVNDPNDAPPGAEPPPPPQRQAPAPQSAPQQGQRTPAASHAAPPVSDELHQARIEINKLANLRLLCEAGASYVDDQLQKQLGRKPMAPSDLKDIATSFFIGMSSRGSFYQDSMPVGVLDVAPKKQ